LEDIIKIYFRKRVLVTVTGLVYFGIDLCDWLWWNDSIKVNEYGWLEDFHMLENYGGVT
jgi:hypothetical protein